LSYGGIQQQHFNMILQEMHQARSRLPNDKGGCLCRFAAPKEFEE